MKCRRCHTNFDYETHYGICPKCAAYNRPDGKDEMKTFMGENAAAYEEEYRPPVMSGGDGMEFSWQDDSDSKKKEKKGKQEQKKAFQQRLENPYLDGTVQKNKKKPVVSEKKSRGKTVWKILVGIAVILLGLYGELEDDGFDEAVESGIAWLEEKFNNTGLTEYQGSYSTVITICGRDLSFGVPYEIQPESKGYLGKTESLLVVPYYGTVVDELAATDYQMNCYLEYDGLYLQPIPVYVLEECYPSVKKYVGDLNGLYGTEKKNMVFVGDFSDLEKKVLKLSFQKREEDGSLSMPEAYYRFELAEEDADEFTYSKESAPEMILKNGKYSAPSIRKIGDVFRGTEAGEGYTYYRITQEFENNTSEPIYVGQLSLDFRDFDYYDIYEWDPDTEENELSFYRQVFLPSGERGYKNTILAIDKESRGIKAYYYDENDGEKEWSSTF